MARILIADPDLHAQSHLSSVLSERGHGTVCASDGPHALQQLSKGEDIHVVLAELKLPGIDGLSLLQEARKNNPDVAVILQTAFGTVEDAVAAMRDGAADFLTKPFTDDQVGLAVDRALERIALVRENADLRAALDDRVRIANLIATAPAMLEIFKKVRAVAQTRTTFLITGESGTGKTVLARALHALSGRSSGPFIEVNCGSLPESLLESELFGHVRGAFTGAVKDRPGKFEAADGGTIFLDEIATSSPGFQVKLLRVLQDRVIERVGDTRSIPIDVRVILATNQDLAAEVKAKRFREDLYYRINVVSVEMPPLRQRPTDIPLLVEHFRQRFVTETGRKCLGFTPEALRVLQAAPWPGNVRQLENAIEHAVVLAETEWIGPAALPLGLDQPETDSPTQAGQQCSFPALTTALAPDLALRSAMDIVEREILVARLQRHGGNREQTASSLAIDRSTLFNKLRKHGL